MAGKREVYENKFNAQLTEWSAQIALLNAKAANAKADASIDYQEAIASLQAKRDAAAAKYHELTAASDDAWDDVKNGAERAWNDVKSAYHDAVSKFKN
jgi:hypothetical protein